MHLVGGAHTEAHGLEAEVGEEVDAAGSGVPAGQQDLVPVRHARGQAGEPNYFSDTATSPPGGGITATDGTHSLGKSRNH